MKQVIARRRFGIRGKRGTVVVSMTKPMKVRGKPAFEVVITIRGAGFNSVRTVLGVDEFQALHLAFNMAGHELESERYAALRWRYGMNARDLGLPRSDDQKLPRALVKDIKAAVSDVRRRSS